MHLNRCSHGPKEVPCLLKWPSSDGLSQQQEDNTLTFLTGKPKIWVTACGTAMKTKSDHGVGTAAATQQPQWVFTVPFSQRSAL